MQNTMIEIRRSWAARWALPVFALGAMAYLAWRFWTVFPSAGWYFWPVIVCECLSIVLTLMYLGAGRRIAVPVFRAPAAARTVDVFIPTYNEPEEVVKPTVIGALHVRGARHVYLLDDGNRPHMRAMAESLGAKYVARQENTHAKAGNMNAGILHSDAELMLFLDCDHVPQPQIVERLAGYFDDPGLAFVQTPQLFYNTASVQFRKTAKRPLWNEQTMFYESIQPSKNCHNAAFFCGSGALVRRAAIDSVGGFATGTATEDIHTSLRLHAQGWRSLFINEPLAHGIAPINMTEYHKQRVRWGAGSLGLLFRSPDSPLRARGLTPMQRLCYFNSTFSFTFGLLRLFYMLFPALMLLLAPWMANDHPVDVLSWLSIMLGFVGFSYWCAWAASDGAYHPVYTEQYNLANMFSHARALRGIFHVSAKFSVSAKSDTAKRRSMPETGLAVLCVVLAAATLYGLGSWFSAGRPAAGLMSSAAGLALAWNGINLLLAAAFLVFLHRHHHRGQPAHAIALPACPAMIANGADCLRVMISAMDLSGATIIMPDGASPRGKYHLTFLNGQDEIVEVPGEIKIAPPDSAPVREAHMTFDALSPELATALTRFLFHVVVPRVLRYGPQDKPAMERQAVSENQDTGFGYFESRRQTAA
jgi:cellulose synthase/poly-beta-1,6-N-acetylglucosamine synthase-like glycosyltransferase